MRERARRDRYGCLNIFETINNSDSSTVTVTVARCDVATAHEAARLQVAAILMVHAQSDTITGPVKYLTVISDFAQIHQTIGDKIHWCYCCHIIGRVASFEPPSHRVTGH